MRIRQPNGTDMFIATAFVIAAMTMSSNLEAKCKPEVEYTAQEQGYYSVMLGGQLISNHTAEREALERASNEAFDGNEVVVVHNYSVLVKVDASTCASIDDTITANLSWTTPTTRTDGSTLPLTEIEGYTLYHGPAADELLPLLSINEPDATAWSLDISPGYFALTTVDTDGQEGPFSNIVSKGL